ncbi:unnamed protein product [Caenorhabditis auriculariae]|uniref:Uncharacterized protein n=1 Tax=Caenorhabditis auriculariae TaxID=2777116 RepID=A0A8S1HHZ4_9PELO|nr:unnamed protein product [Caenorhabditis auriculariae]
MLSNACFFHEVPEDLLFKIFLNANGMSVSTIQRIPSVETTSISQNLRPRRSTGISRSDFVKSLMSAEKEKVSGVASHRIDHHKLVALSLSGRGVVTQMVNRMEKKVAPTATKTKTANSGNQTPARKPPLAEEEKVHIEVVEVPPTENLPQPIKKKQKRNYIGSLTSTKFLHNIFSQSTKDEEKKKKGDSSPTILINDEDPHKARMVAISGAASRVPLLLREKPSPSSYESKLKRTLTEASPDIELPLGGPLRKRLSEGATAVLTSSLQQLKKNSKRLSIVDGDKIFGGLMKLTKGLGGGGGGGGGGATRTSCVERRESDKTTRKSASNRMTKSCHIPAPSLLSPNLDFAAEYTLRPLEPRRTDRPIPSLVLQRRATPPKELEETLVDGADENWLAINRRRPLTVAGGPLMRNERRKMLGSRPMSRTLTVALPPQTLPPLYEHDNGDDATSTTARANEELQKKDRRQLRRYGGSHTTSTFQGRKDAAPDASPRRHLIGFLHRTSHLSLTSEMSGNASFYLIGEFRNFLKVK